MKRETRIKLSAIILTLVFAFAFGIWCTAAPTAAAPEYAKAASKVTKVNLTRSNFSLYYGGTDGVIVQVKLPYSDIQADVQFSLDGKKIKTITTKDYATYKFTPVKNKVYYYRVRAKKNGKYIGSWSKTRAFSTVDYTKTVVQSSVNTVRFSCPANAKIKSTVLYLSQNKNSGYKKIATIKPGKSYTVNANKGFSFTKYVTYYCKIGVTLKSGVPCDNIFMSSFYIYTSYK